MQSAKALAWWKRKKPRPPIPDPPAAAPALRPRLRKGFPGDQDGRLGIGHAVVISLGKRTRDPDQHLRILLDRVRAGQQADIRQSPEPLRRRYFPQFQA